MRDERCEGMDFYLTQKLRKRFIKTEKVMGQSIEDAQLIEKSETEIDPFYHWHGTLSEIGHDELFIFTHNTTGMTLTFLNLVEDELIEFIDLFEEGLTQLLSRFGFPEHAINQYTQSIAGHRLTKATDMKKIGKNSIVHATLGRFTHLIDEDYLTQETLSYALSTLKSHADGHEESRLTHFYHEWVKTIGPVQLTIPMAECEIRLKLEHQKDSIRLVHIPLNLSFEALHDIIQTVFLWQNRHFHQFVLEDGSRLTSSRQIAEMEHYAISEDRQLFSEESTFLSDVISTEENRNFTYIYDFGDDWEHSINFRKLWVSSKVLPPKLLMMMGNPVPEDSGGADGYKYMMDVISDPRHEDHDDLKEWLSDYISLLYSQNTVDSINLQLEHKFK